MGGNAVTINYAYDSRGSITYMSAPQNNGEHWDYTYDTSGQLIQALYQDLSHNPTQWTYNYAYDPNGNRGPGQYSPTDKADTVGTRHYAYDALGNMISDNGATRTYDYENRLTGGSGLTTRKYNAFSQERNYVYDEGREIVSLGATLTSYVRGLNGQLLMELNATNAVNYYAFGDHQGSIMARANSSGTVDGYAKYDPFGKVLTALTGVPFGFTGARYDSAIANYVLGARRYDPAQGRFTTRDTWPANVWEPWTWNLYQYCKNSPQNYVDPTGHVVWGFGGTGFVAQGFFGGKMDVIVVWDDKGNVGLAVTPSYAVGQGFGLSWVGGLLDELADDSIFSLRGLSATAGYGKGSGGFEVNFTSPDVNHDKPIVGLTGSRTRVGANVGYYAALGHTFVWGGKRSEVKEKLQELLGITVEVHTRDDGTPDWVETEQGRYLPEQNLFIDKEGNITGGF
ncbi:MAG: RHS repeat-associated core domain-containing protein [bacterium]|nr:RHS repeat-associated core domain-containing protein [bacterium]